MRMAHSQISGIDTYEEVPPEEGGIMCWVHVD